LTEGKFDLFFLYLLFGITISPIPFLLVKDRRLGREKRISHSIEGSWPWPLRASFYLNFTSFLDVFNIVGPFLFAVPLTHVDSSLLLLVNFFSYSPYSLGVCSSSVSSSLC
jgi:hypothetical protein